MGYGSSISELARGIFSIPGIFVDEGYKLFGTSRSGNEIMDTKINTHEIDKNYSEVGKIGSEMDLLDARRAQDKHYENPEEYHEQVESQGFFGAIIAWFSNLFSGGNNDQPNYDQQNHTSNQSTQSNNQNQQTLANVSIESRGYSDGIYNTYLNAHHPEATKKGIKDTLTTHESDSNEYKLAKKTQYNNESAEKAMEMIAGYASPGRSDEFLQGLKDKKMSEKEFIAHAQENGINPFILDESKGLDEQKIVNAAAKEREADLKRDPNNGYSITSEKPENKLPDNETKLKNSLKGEKVDLNNIVLNTIDKETGEATKLNCTTPNVNEPNNLQCVAAK